ncbi:MFS transporter [Thiomicrorhabdus lithotrophica]|uniref:MFS transporter n=1 Tax=Thiomicrorhabdus lithotrophica TaxID=2949997 RepID=A0ABY8CE96_9GAMM|nr:MFS transporter [Thiomicrorhabdus lithotrophica]WEJ62728.1 MFS transporter [Thiomicrorhabdus lithotrophica]
MQKPLLTVNSGLLFSQKFYPIFWVQFLGAFNDNLFKNALVMLITFRLSHSSLDTGLLITLAAGLFILPFFLFSSLAGQIADHYPKRLLIKKIKLLEVLIMLLGGLALLSQELSLLFLTLFLMGSQSAFFGPIKYSILPEILDTSELLKGNGLFSGSTFIAILLGTILGGIGVLLEDGLWLMSVVIFIVALAGYIFSLRVNSDFSGDSTLQIEWNLFSSTKRMIKESRQHKTAFFSVLSISWFWFIGAVLLSQIPVLVKYDLQANDNVVIVFLALFSIGIALGAGAIGRIMLSQAHIKWHWLMLLGMTATLLLAVVSIANTNFNNLVYLQDAPHGTLLTFTQFIAIWPASMSLIALGALAVLGGAYIVPLYTLLQTHTPLAVRARMVAVNNIVNALLMVLSALLLMVGFALNLSLLNMLCILALLNIIVTIFAFKKRFIVVE